MADIVYQQVMHMFSMSCRICYVVQELDSLVQKGRVRRHAAACMASEVHDVDSVMGVSQDSRNFLRAVLQHHVNAQAFSCECINTVMAWGTCPTVVQRVAMGALTLTSLGINIREQWQRTLLAYGAMPWTGYRVRADRGTGQCVMTFMAYAAHDVLRGVNLCRAQKQWQQWHGRRRKRLWLTVVATRQWRPSRAQSLCCFGLQ
jgi:hypothetical protein